MVEPGGPNAAWDEFVDSTAGGDHVQTSMWAGVKAVAGWRAARVIVRRDNRIIAGCQVLLRDIAGVGAVAYAPRGPVTNAFDPAVVQLILDGIDEIAARERVIYIKLQPPLGGEDAIPVLEARGFHASDLEAAPISTVRVKVNRTPENILAGMSAGHRSNVRKAGRKGVTVRVGEAEDMGTFMEILRGTSRRQGFTIYPDEYYATIWRLFASRDQGRLLISELDGRPLSSVLLVASGDTVLYKMGGWVGEPRNIHPNELTHYTGMLWARERGCEYYDLEGVPISWARAFNAGLDPDLPPRGDARFKLRFGGEVTIFPGPYDYAYKPLLALAARRVAGLGSSQHFIARRLLGRTLS